MPKGIYNHLKLKKQFCKYEHDTFTCGRDRSGTCKKCANIRIVRWMKLNRDRIRPYERNYNRVHSEKLKIYYEKNKVKINEKRRRWEKENPKIVRAWFLKSQLKRLHRVPKYGQEGITEFYVNRPDGYEVDHIIPLNGKLVSGLHVIWNLQYLTKEENRKKHNKFN